MLSQKIIISNKSGLHLRPASELSKIAINCKSNITIIKEDKRVNPKSILNLMNAGIKYGDEITIECSGDTEEQDFSIIVNYILGSPKE
ncbi:MAG: phosphocarrier HPr family [Firmicutes bacterium]|nr:phosphocarrier HPr family [Bacillota bacterium]